MFKFMLNSIEIQALRRIAMGPLMGLQWVAAVIFLLRAAEKAIIFLPRFWAVRNLTAQHQPLRERSNGTSKEEVSTQEVVGQEAGGAQEDGEARKESRQEDGRSSYRQAWRT
jgi:hypothetical protein